MGLVFFGLVFNFLFYKASLGLNLALFNLFCIGLAIFLNRDLLKNYRFLWYGLGLVLLSVAMFLHASEWTIAVNVMALFVFAGVISNPPSKSYMYQTFQSIDNVAGFFGARDGISTPPAPAGLNTNSKSKTSIWKRISGLAIYLIPALIVIVFIILYRNSSSFFNEIIDYIETKLDVVISWVKDFLPKFSFRWILLFLFGLIVGRFIFQGIRKKMWIIKEHLFPEFLVRKRVKTLKNYGKGLNTELKTGVFLFVSLNTILALMNFTDFANVWVGFKWNNQLLREFVHQGTWMLILSIMLGIAIVLFYFKGNLNFYSKSTTLKFLTQVWIYQNVFLVLSVIVRNYHYIYHYGLAYKRIGVLFFCVFILLVLFFLSLKTGRKETFYVFMRRCFAGALTVVLCSAVWDWANIIVKYNLANKSHNYIHLSFFADMPDRCLPSLKLNNSELKELIENQNKLNFELTDRVDDSTNFNDLISKRVEEFKKVEENKRFQEFTWYDRRAYEQLGLKR